MDRLEAPRLAADYTGLASEDYDFDQWERDAEEFVEAVRGEFSPTFKPVASIDTSGGKKRKRKSPAP